MTLTWIGHLLTTLLVVLIVVATTAAIVAHWNHRRLLRLATLSGGRDLDQIGAELLQAIKAVSQNRRQPVSMSNFWKGEYRSLKHYERYAVIERLTNSGVISTSSGNDEGGWNLIALVSRYAFCVPPTTAVVSDLVWERMAYEGASATTIIHELVTHELQIDDAEIGEVVMGDKIEAGKGATVINRSQLLNSLNAVSSSAGPEVAEALKTVASMVEKLGDDDATENFNGLTEELESDEPRKPRLKLFWNGVVEALPGVAQLGEATSKIVSLFS